MPSKTAPAGNYRDTAAYKNADAATRRQLERWKADQKIDDAQMYLLMARQTLRDLPAEKKKEGNRAGEMMVVFAILFFMFAWSTQQRAQMLIASLLVIFSTVLFISGALNPYSGQLRQLRKALKAYTEPQPFADWCAANPEPAPKGKKGQQAAAAKKAKAEPAEED